MSTFSWNTHMKVSPDFSNLLDFAYIFQLIWLLFRILVSKELEIIFEEKCQCRSTFLCTNHIKVPADFTYFEGLDNIFQSKGNQAVGNQASLTEFSFFPCYQVPFQKN